MTRERVAMAVWALVAGLVIPETVAADVIHLTNGRAIEVEAWQDAGDAIEFAMGGGIIRISKAEVQKIDGTPTRAGLKMYSAPPSAATSSLDTSASVKQMADLLKQGEGLFAQTILSPAEKAGAFRRLSYKWREFEVPEALQEAHGRGLRALQLAAEAFGAEEEGALPNVKERIEAARTEMQAAQDEVKKAAGEKS